MAQLDQLKQIFNQKQVPFKEKQNLSEYTSFKIGGPADIICLPENEEQLLAAICGCRSLAAHFVLLGLGSNVLFQDDGYPGVVICTRYMNQQPHVDGSEISSGCGISLHRLCREAEEAGLTGLEFAYGIPGSLGGAIYMNAGAYGGEMKDVVAEVTILDEFGEIRTLASQELQLGYRTSVFCEMPWIILGAKLRLVAGDRALIRGKMDELMQKRRDKQPLDYPSAGSAFKRPQGAYAAALIEECGLKGLQVGGAAVSDKHSGFIVNMGGATCLDVLNLADQVVKTVQEKTGYLLEKEIRVIH